MFSSPLVFLFHSSLQFPSLLPFHEMTRLDWSNTAFLYTDNSDICSTLLRTCVAMGIYGRMQNDKDLDLDVIA